MPLACACVVCMPLSDHCTCLSFCLASSRSRSRFFSLSPQIQRKFCRFFFEKEFCRIALGQCKNWTTRSGDPPLIRLVALGTGRGTPQPTLVRHWRSPLHRGTGRRTRRPARSPYPLDPALFRTCATPRADPTSRGQSSSRVKLEGDGQMGREGARRKGGRWPAVEVAEEGSPSWRKAGGHPHRRCCSYSAAMGMKAAPVPPPRAGRPAPPPRA
jgi:hypothetical protein